MSTLKIIKVCTFMLPLWFFMKMKTKSDILWELGIMFQKKSLTMDGNTVKKMEISKSILQNRGQISGNLLNFMLLTLT